MYIILQKAGQLRWLKGSIIITAACVKNQLRNARVCCGEVECLCNKFQQRLMQADQGLERTGG
jgi:hypothetical protein